MRKIGLLTGGGDCPGLNAAIRAVVRKAIKDYDYEIIGIRSGWTGLINGMVEPLTHHSVSGILPKGGTILGTSRNNPLSSVEKIQKLKANFRSFGLSGLIVIGGIDTLRYSAELFEKEGLPIVGIPKTIDNNLNGTDYTIGFDTASQIITQAIDRLHTTAEAHNRIIVVEVMGGKVGWLATIGGMGGGADLILIPEVPHNIDVVCNILKERHRKGKDFSIVVAAEGVEPSGDDAGEYKKDPRGWGIGEIIADQIEKRTGYETRVTVLGHIQRGGTPTTFDRVLATKLGITAVELVSEDKFGVMVGIRGEEIINTPLKEVTQSIKSVPRKIYEMAHVFFG